MGKEKSVKGNKQEDVRDWCVDHQRHKEAGRVNFTMMREDEKGEPMTYAREVKADRVKNVVMPVSGFQRNASTETCMMCVIAVRRRG